MNSTPVFAKSRLCLLLIATLAMAACNASDDSPDAGTGTGGGQTGGSGGGTGSVKTGGTSGTGGATGGDAATGGISATGGRSTGGSARVDGGTDATGGVTDGGLPPSGGAGGHISTGGTNSGMGGGSGAGFGGSSGGRVGGGQGGDAGSTGLGGSSEVYRPCPTNGDPCRILPLGDSITYGFTYNGDPAPPSGYRLRLFANAVAAGQKITFTGSLANGPDAVSGVTFPKHHEGHGGWRIAQLTPLIPSPAFDAASGGMPHIVLLHIGTNDTCCTGVSNMLNNLGTLIDKITSQAPNALIVVAKITPMVNPSYAAAVKGYIAGIPDLVKARTSAGKHIVIVDMNTDFPTSDLQTDGVHPTKQGYDLMADRWYAVIAALLPQ